MSARRKQAESLPSAIRPYVEVLGEELAVRLFLTLGGSVVYLADRPQDRSKLSEILTADQIRALSQRVTEKWQRVPTAKRYIACHLRAAGMPVAEIARTLHVADWSVRRWTNADEDCAPAAPSRQISLFD